VASLLARTGGALLEVDLASRRAQRVTDASWRVAHIAAQGDTVSLIRGGRQMNYEDSTRRGFVSARTLVRDVAGWHARDSAQFAPQLFHPAGAVAASDRYIVGVSESLDSPPELAVVDRATGRAEVVTALNPALAAVPRGAIRLVTWKSARGDTWNAHLVTPVGYVPGKRYPAVVMVMDMSYNDEYVLDGRFYKSTYPIQALANRGVVVLMTYYPRVFFDEYEQPPQREIVLTGTDGAFEYLVREGLADSTRIGITGFSYAGYVTQYAITQSRHRYAAAIAIDNFDASYVSYILVSTPSVSSGIERLYGGGPYGSAQATWLREAPGFNAANVRTPLLLEEHSTHMPGEPGTRFFGWEPYSALRLLGKPVELVRYPYGEHVLQQATEQYSQAHRHVDWLCFWLKDEIDPAPWKAEQYERWRAMR
jgi:dipeptidyl aminopeptidase/acylaminoacyl peptidase